MPIMVRTAPSDYDSTIVANAMEFAGAQVISICINENEFFIFCRYDIEVTNPSEIDRLIQTSF